jgi:hypothetical protein
VEGSKFLRNVHIYLENYTVSQSRRLQAEPVVLYGCEILWKENRLMVFENRELRGMLRLKREEVTRG